MTAKRAIPNSCGRRARATAVTTKAARVSQAARRVPSPRRRAITKRQPKMIPTRSAREHDQTGPAGQLVDRREQDLGAPLLVDPRRAGRRERPRVDGRERPCREDLLARAQVVGEVDRGQVRDERGEDRQRDGQERPESGQGHAAMLAAAVRRGTGPMVLAGRARPRTGGRRAAPRRRSTRWR